jgi:hypothetical protein
VVVVAPGDSLWSISAQRLGRGATAQQVARGVEQIYALNKDQIGPDPNLLIAGQRLSLPQETDGGAVAHPNDAKATSTPPSARREDTGTAPTAAVTSTESGQEADAGATTVRGETSEASRPIEAVRAAANKAVPKASEDAARPVSAEKQASSEDSPLASLLRSVRSVVSSAPSAVAGESRTTQGWMVLVLTAVVGALMAWKLPMRRTTRWEAERWGAPYGYYGRGLHATYSVNLAMPTVERDERGQRAPHENPASPVPVALEGSSTNGSEATGSEANGSEANGAGTKRPKVVRHALAGSAPRRSRAKLKRLGGAAARNSGRSVVRNGLVTGVTRAEVHHALRVPPNGGIQAVRRRVGRRR